MEYTLLDESWGAMSSIAEEKVEECIRELTNPKVSDSPLPTREVENNGLLVTTEGEHIPTNPCQNKGVTNLVQGSLTMLSKI